jgi:hypothetical protein
MQSKIQSDQAVDGIEDRIRSAIGSEIPLAAPPRQLSNNPYFFCALCMIDNRVMPIIPIHR